VASDKRTKRVWTAEQKAQVISAASTLTREQLTVYLDRARIRLAQFERWQQALEGGQGPKTTSQRIRALERELARKEQALAETAALLLLRQAIASHYQDKVDDIDEPGAI
jgi:hypothetical protein